MGDLTVRKVPFGFKVEGLEEVIEEAVVRALERSAKEHSETIEKILHPFMVLDPPGQVRPAALGKVPGRKVSAVVVNPGYEDRICGTCKFFALIKPNGCGNSSECRPTPMGMSGWFPAGQIVPLDSDDPQESDPQESEGA